MARYALLQHHHPIVNMHDHSEHSVRNHQHAQDHLLQTPQHRGTAAQVVAELYEPIHDGQ